MIIVTGAAGFIGSNLIKGLNRAGYENILAVDDLTDGHKFQNLAAVRCMDYLDYEDALAKIQSQARFPEPVEAIFHEGACSVTTEWNGRYMMRVNYEYSKHLLHYCVAQKIPLIYASSAAVYGAGTQFDDQAALQYPINVYGYSKWQFDRYQLQFTKNHASSQVVGLRYFNVYGPHEQHKGAMASVAFHFMNQLKASGEVKLFAGDEQYADGEQRRDFIFVDDVVKVNLWFLKNPHVNGVFNVGAGKARSFNDLANTLIRLHGGGRIRYIPFPDHLKGAYQNFTQADLRALRAAGYLEPFTELEDGLSQYYHALTKDTLHVF